MVARQRLISFWRQPIPAGSTELFLRGRENLKLGVEYLVLQEPWSQPFGDEQFAVARKRLREVTVEPPGSSA